jgi:hypothetical protein
VGVVATAIVGTLMDEFGPVAVERVAGEAPITALIGADGAAHSDGWKLFMPQGLDPAGQPRFKQRPTAEEVRSWFVERGAYDVDTSELRISLLGRSREPVQVRDLRARILSRAEPPAGVLIDYPSAGENRIVAVEIDLDQDAPTAQIEGRPYFEGYFLSLAHREVQEMRIAANTRTEAVEWEIELEYTWRGGTSTLRLDNDGEPFRTTPRVSVDKTYHWQWWEEEPSLIADAPST